MTGQPETLDRQALEDILNGACVLGSGGGGPYVVGEQLLKDVLGGGPVRVVAPSDVGDDAWMAVSAAAGSPDAATGGAFPAEVATAAYRGLATSVGRPFTHVLAGEVGAGNSFIPMIPAGELAIPLVDASGSPRAIPMLTQCTFAPLPISPVMVADTKTEISYSAPSAAIADPTLRAVVASGSFPGFAGVAMWSMDGTTMLANALAGTLSRARALGQAIREAKASGADPVAAACKLLGGFVLFTGENLQENESTGGGFDVGTVSLTSGSETLTIYNQNENLIAWSSARGTPVALAPDLICYLTTEGQPFSNATPDVERFATGKQVAVIGVPAKNLGFDSPAIVEAFASLLATLGYPGPYVPIEKLNPELAAGGA